MKMVVFRILSGKLKMVRVYKSELIYTVVNIAIYSKKISFLGDAEG